MDRISVIIPTKNRKNFLTGLVDNLKRQTFAGFETIIVDDNSTDGTWEWLQGLKNDHFIVLKNYGTGQGAAMNTGFRAARGNYVKFFDSDDLLTVNTLETQLTVLKKSGKGFVYSPYFYMIQKPDGSFLPKDDIILNYFPLLGNKPFWHWMIFGLFVPIPAMLFQRDLLAESGPWREDVATSLDFDYLFRISLLEPFPAHTPACAFLYRLHGEQITDNQSHTVQRDLDKQHVLETLYYDIVLKSAQFSFAHKKIFQNKLYHLYRFAANDRSLRENLNKYDTLTGALLWQFLRLKQTTGRFVTGSDWQPYHGVYRNREKIKSYLQLF